MPVRAVIQRVNRVRLLLNNQNAWGECGAGLLVYVAFLKETSEADIAEFVQLLMSTKLIPRDLIPPEAVISTHGKGSLLSLSECRCGVCLVPQASLGGKRSSAVMQFHNLMAPEVGATLWTSFCDKVIAALSVQGTEGRVVSVSDTAVEMASVEPVVVSGAVVVGTFGNRQALDVQSDGPFTVILEK